MAVENSITRPARRSFLALLTGAMAAPAAAVAASPAAPAVDEAPELLALGRQLDEALEAFREAVARKAEAVEIWERMRPEVPEELVGTALDRRDGLTVQEVGLDGSVAGAREIFSSREIRIQMLRRNISGRTKEGRRLHRLVRLAKSYEKGIAEAYRVSNYEACERDADKAAQAVHAMARQALDIEPVTVEGLLILARLTAAVTETYDLGELHCLLGGAVGVHTAKAAVRILAKARA